ncbi:SusC/RagA family TonB-linked outer membrane protein [Olivibacter sp. SDN3]|uniref:SusC/RagA family TonB-linked outer membrane protein n=1 Tax=Olivibacter sp. SDN3 TaxID=2764720 RepID=UPI0016511552|nr:SusC/RagA family TonB-linked outer membrane protein [Olivibacter sp. SDN3]QNL50456.1 SusC/RagA family TonB-linked outer membrane protein [Olivibacter sp. SDN3]
MLTITLLVGISCLPLQAQTDSIKGVVKDEFGRPLAGVIIQSENKRNGTSTDHNGAYSLALNDESKNILFKHFGYQTLKEPIGTTQPVNVVLQIDGHRKDEEISLGYTSQKRAALTGAVATVRGEELERVPVANLTQSFPGRFVGLFTQETSSELSRTNTDLFVRGLSAARMNGPLVMIDGIISSYNSGQILEYITANEIESISVLKDASTQALYGIQGANGLLVITTKRGRKGALEITGRLDHAMQEVTHVPRFYSAADYALMRNQAAFNDGQGSYYLFSADEIEKFRTGEDPELYPDNNWYDRYMNRWASMQRAAVNATGGNDRVRYFSNINLMRQGGQFNTDQTEYNTNPYNVWVNYRSNVDMVINKYLNAYVRLSGNIKREHTPGSSNADVYNSIFQLPPTTYGPLTPEIIDPETGAIIVPGGKVITTERVTSPTYGRLNRSGYVNHTVTNINSQFGLDLDMSFLTKGLKMNGAFAYQTNSVGSLSTLQDYERWVRNSDLAVLEFNKKGSEMDSPLAYSKSSAHYYHLTYNTVLNYSRDFGKHRVSGLAYMFYQNLTKADTGAPESLPYDRVSSGIEGAYDYDNRYFLKVDIGYSGSEQYARESRFIATPAIAAGWAVGNEQFASTLNWLTELKLRASYGKTANDQSGLQRFAYLDNLTLSGGGPIGYLQYIINEHQFGNPLIQAEVSTKQNYGLDLGIANALSVTVDVFRERMNNMVVGAVSAVPLYQGVPLNNYPRLNEGQFENKGYEIAINYSKTFSRNFSAYLGGMFTYAKNTIISWNEASRTDDFAFRKWEEGYSFGQQFGYLVDYNNGNGFFNTQEELTTSNLVYGFGTPRVGDLKFQDLNGDGQIDERDQAPIGTGSLPRIVYAFSGGFSYKALDMSFLFQGVGQYSSIMNGLGVYETELDGIFGSLHANAWTPERYAAGEEITYPALSLAQTVNHESSDFFNYDRSYLRLKNLEIGYTLPLVAANTIAAKKIRIMFSGHNLITWHRMKTADFGPEGGGFGGFPVYRVYNIGASLTF